MPRVSVCVSVLNQPELLQNTLESVRAQTFTDWECIVVDDGSNVPIEPIIPKDERFIYHRFEQNKGIPHGANYAYKIARGEFVQPLACDEIIAPTKFADQVAYFDEHPEIDCIWGVPGNGPMGPVPEWEQYSRAAHNRSREHWIKCFINLEGIPIGGASALWRTKVFDSIGYFDPTLTAFSDHEWFCRFFEKHQGIILPYRWMNEIPGHKTISTRTPANGAKMDAELQYVRYKHPLITPQTDGLITIAVPVYNHSKFVGAALESVFAQTDKNFDVIVMDDGSTDDLKTALKPYWDRITYFRSEENCGHMATVNKMLNLAKGDFFVSFSADDTMSPDFLEKCRKEFKADQFYEMVASQNDFMKEDGTPWEGPHPFLTIPKATNRTREE